MLQGVVWVIMTLQSNEDLPRSLPIRASIYEDLPRQSARLGFSLRGFPSNQPRTTWNGFSMNAPRSCSGHHDPTIN
jgi:hypothetical protein